MKEIKILISMFAVAIIITIIITISSLNNKKVTKSTEHKYDINKTVKELDLKTINDYIVYLNELKLMIEPKELRELIIINRIEASIYKEAALTQKKTGLNIKKELMSSAYEDLIEIVIQKNEKWDKLPLTEHFKSKFNEKDGCIKEIDSEKIYVHNFGYSDDNKTFSIEYSYIPDDAYEKYPAEQIEFMLEYGAGAYNLDYYNYQYVLDDEGYLDDIIFLGITPHIVEGRYVDEDE